MDLLNRLYLTDVLHTISDSLALPVVVLLLALIIYAIYAIGTVLVEIFMERKHWSAEVPELVARLDAAGPENLTQVIEESGLLRPHKDDLDEMVSYMYLPEDARTEVAKRLLANENEAYMKVIGRTDVMAKIAPMLGLMGTLIPLGPGIVALGEGDTATLSSALLVAFDTTVAGLATAVVCFIISRLRRRWYGDYLVSLEAALNTLLEKANILQEQGYEFEKTVYSYDAMGRTAHLEALDGGSVSEKARARLRPSARSETFSSEEGSARGVEPSVQERAAQRAKQLFAKKEEQLEAGSAQATQAAGSEAKEKEGK